VLLCQELLDDCGHGVTSGKSIALFYTRFNDVSTSDWYAVPAGDRTGLDLVGGRDDQPS
jgi:hypothetical protein